MHGSRYGPHDQISHPLPPHRSTRIDPRGRRGKSPTASAAHARLPSMVHVSKQTPGGLALFAHVRLQSNRQLMTARVVHVTNLLQHPPGVSATLAGRMAWEKTPGDDDGPAWAM